MEAPTKSPIAGKLQEKQRLKDCAIKSIAAKHLGELHLSQRMEAPSGDEQKGDKIILGACSEIQKNRFQYNQ